MAKYRVAWLPGDSANLGLRLVICSTIKASEGYELETAASDVINVTTGKPCPIVALPPARQAVIDAGGLIPYVRARLMAA